MLRIQTSPYLATDYWYDLNVIFQSSDMTMYILFRNNYIKDLHIQFLLKKESAHKSVRSCLILVK